VEPFEKLGVHFIAGKQFSRTSSTHTVAEGGKELFKEKAVGTQCGVDVPLTISETYWYGGAIKARKNDVPVRATGPESNTACPKEVWRALTCKKKGGLQLRGHDAEKSKPGKENYGALLNKILISSNKEKNHTH